MIGLTAERGRAILRNDAHLDPRAGHVAGTPIGEPEAIVRQMATRLLGTFRGADCVCRIGGDEFALILAHATAADAETVARRIEQALSESPFRLPSGDVTQTASIGIATSETAALHDPEQLLREADRAMYVAKRRAAEPVTLKLVADASG